MFFREGSQLRVSLLSLAGTALAAVCTFDAALAADTARSNRVELPKEVLPWRRDVERQAWARLQGARRSIRTGNRQAARRQLRDIAARFPRTHAAADAHRDLTSLHESRVARQNLGAPQRLQHDGPTPVAGWHTTVRPDTSRLSDAFVDAAGDRVFFKQDSIRLGRHAKGVLRQQARWLKRHRDVEVRIVGHADDKGSQQKNMRLSHDRAVAVRKRLIRFGISPRRLHVFSHGKAQPIAICTVDTCAVQNRRVVTELKLTGRTAANAH